MSITAYHVFVEKYLLIFGWKQMTLSWAMPKVKLWCKNWKKNIQVPKLFHSNQIVGSYGYIKLIDTVNKGLYFLDIPELQNQGKINLTATFHKWICNLTPEVRDILKILWKREEIAPKKQFLLFSTIFYYLLLHFHFKTGTRFSLRDKQLFEMSSQDYKSQLYLGAMTR